jgi:hypothetical protein
MVAAGRGEIPLRTPARTAAASGEMSLPELRYNWRETACARSSADRALASGARGQRFESSRAYPPINSIPLPRSPHGTAPDCPAAHGILYVRLRTWRVRVNRGSVSIPVGGPRGSSPRDPPLQGLPPTPRRPAQAAPAPSLIFGASRRVTRGLSQRQQS